MFTTKARGLALAIGATALVGAAVTAGGSASADPKQYDAPFVLVGSDTTENLMNAFAGFENGISYTPLQSDSASGQKQIVSWDATKDGLTTTCITTRTGGPSFNRPNGSTAGRNALLAAYTAGGTTSVSNCGTGTTSPSGQISGARSSSLSGTGGSTLAYVPFARDALSFGFYKPVGGTATAAAVTSLSASQLNSIFNSATGVVVGSVRIFGCDIQTGSGTGNTWRTKWGYTTGTAMGANTAVCDGAYATANSLSAGTLMQENDGSALQSAGDSIFATGTYAGQDIQVIVGFSVGGYIGKANGVARGGMPAAVGIGTPTTFDIAGTVTNSNSPIVYDVAGTLTATDGTVGRPNLQGNSSYYTATSGYGRDLYNVFPASVINSAFGNDALKQIFKNTAATGNNALICQTAAVNVIKSFGFLTVSTCGDSTSNLRGA